MVSYAKNASKLHKKVGEILTTLSPWTGFKTEQEVLVSSLFPSWEYGTERYDWVIHSLSAVIECHGVQHYNVQSFGADAGEALMSFQGTQFRDNKKQEIAELHNWTYIIIPYTDEKKIDADYLMELYNAKKTDKMPIVDTPKPTKKSEYATKQLELARQYRREQYERQKEYKKRNKK